MSVSKLLLSFCIFFLVALAGCGGKEFVYQPEAGEMQQGPGLISGEDGVFTIYRAKEEEDQKDLKEPIKN